MRTGLALLLASTALLAACGESERREFLYKPAYCLAGGLANMGREECLPQALKENAEAVASAKLNQLVEPQTPAEDTRVYYTADQRAAVGYTIARELFAPDEKLTRGSATMSLEAAHIIDPLPVKKRCGADKARRDTIDFVTGLMAEHAINRDTAGFLAENYTDLQLAELYRVATSGGALADVKSDLFVMPDPKRKGQTINVTPKGGTAMGGILSYTTSRVASATVEKHKQHIEAVLKERTALHRAELCPPKEEKPAAAPVEETPAATPATQEVKE